MTSVAVVPMGYTPAGPFKNQLARLAHKLLLLTSMTKERRDGGHYIPMSDNVWRSLFGGKASLVKIAAIEAGLIERNKRYSVGGFPQSFRLAKRFRSGRFETIELTRKPRRTRTKPFLDDRLGKVGIQLTERFERFQISNVIPSDPWSCFAVDRVKANDYYSMRCDFGRFHSNFTSLPKHVRKELSTSEPLASIDIKNIQPLILGLLANNTQPHNHTQTTHIPICHTLFSFLRTCEAGQIYEFCLERFQAREVKPYWVERSNGKPFLCDPSRWDRSQVKQAFVICLFDRVERTKTNPVFQVLQKHFPPIADFVIRSKRDEYQALARQCQRFESKVMIDGVSAVFMARHPDAPILTIHDELILPARLVQSAANIIQERFQAFGASPGLRVETFQEQ